MDREQRIIVLGGGIAGKLIAKILCEKYSHVTLVTGGREEVFQSNQLHVLLAGGWQIMSQYFPHTIAQLVASCPRVDWGRDSFWISPVGVMPELESGVVTHTCSRGLLDRLMSAEIADLPIDFVHQRVKSFRLNDERSKVASVETEAGMLEADIVIDAMGRTSLTLDWLKEHAGIAIAEKRVDTQLRYSTTTAEFKKGTKAQQSYYQIDPQAELSGGVILPIEDGKVIACYIYLGQEPDKLWQGIKNERFTGIAANLINASPERKVSQLHNVWHQVERSSEIPSNLYMVGDSVCQFNPVFGQGMTQALRSSEILASSLVRNETSSDFHKQQAKHLRFPWMMATLDPYNPSVKLSLSQRMMRWWVYKQMKLAKKDSTFQQKLIEVLHMKTSPVALYRAGYIIKTLVS